MKAIVAGASGLVGSEIVRRLLVDSRYENVSCVVRRPLSFSHPKLTSTVVRDFSELTDQPLESPDFHAYCAVGTTIKTAGSRTAFRNVDYDSILQFADWAKAAQSFSLVSSMGADADSKIFYSQVKGETENALIERKMRSLHIFRPGLLLGDRAENRTAEKAFSKAYEVLAPFLPASLKRRWVTHASNLALVMIEKSFDQKLPVRIFEAKELGG